MQSKVPLPTDNIYKFYAFFGLLLLITSLYLFVSVYDSNKEKMQERFIEGSKLENIVKLSPDQKDYKKFLENDAEVDKINYDTYMDWISVFIFISSLFIIFGFGMWQFSVQPKQDKLLKLSTDKLTLELEITKLELEKLKNNNG